MTPEQLHDHYDQQTDSQLLAESVDWTKLITEAQLCLAAVWSVRRERAPMGEDADVIPIQKWRMND